MKDVVFTSCAFGPLYSRQQDRLKRSIQDLYPDANIRFWKSVKTHTELTPGEWPPGSKTHMDSMYGFKVHCVNNCLQDGFKKIIFLDPAVVLAPGLEQILENLSINGVMAAKDDTMLQECISKSCLEWLGKTKEDIKHLTLVGGSVYLFDFNHPITYPFFRYWFKMEAEGVFGSQHECTWNGGEHGTWNNHRMDETCFSLCLDKFGLKPSPGLPSDIGTQIGNKNSVFHKFHFNEYRTIHEHTIREAIPPNSNILDLGCRNFGFTNYLRSKGHSVYPVDIDSPNEPGLINCDENAKEHEIVPGQDYYRIAISDKDGRCAVARNHDPNATHIMKGDEIPMMTVESFSKHVGVQEWDIIKMDIEGQELDILMNSKHPIAHQISVEFHTHCTPQTKETIDACLDHLRQWYYIDNVNWVSEHGCSENYWDILLINKSIYSSKKSSVVNYMWENNDISKCV